MRPILKWLENKFSRHANAADAEERHTPVRVRVRPTVIADEDYAVEVSYAADVPDPVVSHRSEKDISMPDIYACDDTIANQQFSILNESLLDATEPDGFDPYNTGRIDTSRAWTSRSSK